MEGWGEGGEWRGVGVCVCVCGVARRVVKCDFRKREYGMI